MSENTKTEISNARTLEEIGEFWDTHSLDDHWDKTREAEFKVRVTQRKDVIKFKVGGDKILCMK